ncbi:MAG: NIPSNAP family protein [Dehalococcoidia bacterium]
MLYELRVYEVLPGRMPALNKRFAEVTLGIFKRFDMDVVGFWTNEIGGYSNELVYMMRFADMADREQKWAKFGADEEWRKARAASEADGLIVNRIRASFLRPTNYSPMK